MTIAAAMAISSVLDHPFLPADEVIVDEDPREGRDDEAWDDEQQTAQARRTPAAPSEPASRRRSAGSIVGGLRRPS